jgi:hypothetical protein
MYEQIKEKLENCLENEVHMLIITVDAERDIYGQFFIEDQGETVAVHWEFVSNKNLSNYQLSASQIQQLEVEGFELDVNYYRDVTCHKETLDSCLHTIARKTVDIFMEIYEINSFDAVEFESFN